MTLQLSNDQLTVTFKELGGELSSIKDKDGIEYLWQGDATYWGGQAPVLFPICGSLRDNETLYPANANQQKKGQMPRHGLVRKEVFNGTQLSDKEVVYQLKSTPGMFDVFPYHFKLASRYRLEGSRIRVTYEVTNLEAEFAMPFTIGGHPGFNCPLLADEQYEDYYLSFEEPETVTVPKVFPETGLVDLTDRTPFLENAEKLDLDYELFRDDTLVLDQLHSKVISLRSKNHDKGIAFHLGDFPFLVLWSTANKGPFIALEPWLGMSTSKHESNYFADKINTQWLEAGQTRSYSFEIEVL